MQRESKLEAEQLKKRRQGLMNLDVVQLLDACVTDVRGFVARLEL